MKYALVSALIFITGSAHAATFVSEAKGNTVIVFSSSKMKEWCHLENTFSYQYDGKRYTTTQDCAVDVVPGNHLEVCRVSDKTIGEPKIEAPVKILECLPSRKP